MNTRELIDEIKNRVANGENKAALFEQFRKEIPKESHVAFLIASTATPENILKTRQLRIILISLVALLTLPLTFFAHYFVTQVEYQRGALEWLFTLAIGVAFPLLNALGMLRHRFPAYTNFMTTGLVFVVLAVVALHQHAMTMTPTILVSLGLAIALIVYCGYVRSLLFPAISWFGTVKKNSQQDYQFD